MKEVEFVTIAAKISAYIQIQAGNRVMNEDEIGEEFMKIISTSDSFRLAEIAGITPAKALIFQGSVLKKAEEQA